MRKRARCSAVPEHLAVQRRVPRSLSLIVMKSFKPSGLNEPVKRQSLSLEASPACAASIDTLRREIDVCARGS